MSVGPVLICWMPSLIIVKARDHHTLSVNMTIEFGNMPMHQETSPPGHQIVESYLGGWPTPPAQPDMQHSYTDVLAAIHALPSDAAGQRYRECTNPPYNALKHQDGLGVTQDVKDLLNDGITLLFFNGIHDLICNHVGNEIMLEHLEWNHQADYLMSKRFGWKSPSTGQLAGYMKHFQNLMFLKVLDSGHMVPMDVPLVSLEMMQTLFFAKSFDTYEQVISRSNKPPGCPICPAVAPVPDMTPKECPLCPECPTSTSSSSSYPVPMNETDSWNQTNLPHHPPPVKATTSMAQEQAGLFVMVGGVILTLVATFYILRNKRRTMTQRRLQQQQRAFDLPYMDHMELPPTYQDVLTEDVDDDVDDVDIDDVNDEEDNNNHDLHVPSNGIPSKSRFS